VNTRTIEVDQFIAASPAEVWNALTTPDLLSRWWAEGDIRPSVGHRFQLDMGSWGHVACEVLDLVPEQRLVFAFGDWTLTWRLVPEGSGTRLFLEHAGFDPNDPQHRFAFDNMGPGWRDRVLPRLAETLRSRG